MDDRVWTDNCPRCCTTCAPVESAVHGDQHMDAYTCSCGWVWMTTRSVEGYAEFEFTPASTGGAW